MRNKKIKTNPDKISNPEFKLGGWFSGNKTYLWFGIEESFLGCLSGQKLYRLAKAIVRNFENDWMHRNNGG